MSLYLHDVPTSIYSNCGNICICIGTKEEMKRAEEEETLDEEIPTQKVATPPPSKESKYDQRSYRCCICYVRCQTAPFAYTDMYGYVIYFYL